MSEGFTNPIVGGAETLIRSAIKSFNYATGVAGWRITRDGDAEFNDATIRGSLIAGGGNVRVDSSGLYIEGPTLQYGIDTIGGFYSNRIPDDGSFVQILEVAGTFGDSFGGIIYLMPTTPSANGNSFIAGNISAQYDASGATDRPLITISSPKIVGLEVGLIDIYGQRSTSATDDSLINLDAQTVNADQNFTIRGIDGGRGTVSTGGRAANSAAIGNVETDLYTCSNFTFKAERAYQIDTTGMHTISVANNRPLYRLRKSSGGTQIVARSIGESVAGAQEDASWDGVFYVTGADVTCSPVVSVIGSAAFTVTVLGPYGSIIKDIGPASLISGWAFQLT